VCSIVRPPTRLDPDTVAAISVVATVALCGLLGLPATAIALVWLAAAGTAVVAPAGVVAGAIATLPWFFHPLGVGSAAIPASELLLTAAAAGAGMRVVLSLVLNRPMHRTVALASLRGIATSRLVIAGLVVAVAGLLIAIWPYDATHRAESLREWRWTLAEPLALVAVRSLAGRRSARLAAAALLAGAAVAGIQGFGDLLTGGGVSVDGTRRVAGPYPHPNALALYLARATAFGAAWWLADARVRHRLAPVVAVVGLATLATLSRGAFLAMGIAGMLVLWRAPRRLRATGYAAGAVAVAGLILVARDRMLDLFSGGSGSLRLAIWDSALQMIADRPLRGYGNDQFLYAYLPKYVHPVAWSERFTAHAHNFVLDFWVRLGIIGVAFAAVAAGACLVSAWRFATGSGRREALAGAASVGLVAVIVHGLVDNAYFAHDLAMSAWLLGWLAFGHAEPAQREEAANHARARDRRRWLHRITPERKPARGRP